VNPPQTCRDFSVLQQHSSSNS